VVADPEALGEPPRGPPPLVEEYNLIDPVGRQPSSADSDASSLKVRGDRRPVRAKLFGQVPDCVARLVPRDEVRDLLWPQAALDRPPIARIRYGGRLDVGASDAESQLSEATQRSERV
jgi:hypothetical protein